MNLTFRRKVMVAALVVAAGGFAISLAPSIGQDAKTEKKAKGRLPAYYADIVTDQQKEKIYTIQAKHQDKIAELNASLAAATKARDAEIEAVLTPEQKAKLTAAQDEASAKKKKTAADKKASEDSKKTATEAKTTKAVTETKTTPKSK